MAKDEDGGYVGDTKRFDNIKRMQYNEYCQNLSGANPEETKWPVASDVGHFFCQIEVICKIIKPECPEIVRFGAAVHLGS